MAERLSTGLRDAMVGAGGSSMADALNDGIIKIYTGSQPADADSAETGTLLATITQDSAAFTSGVATNGLSFGAASSGSAAKTSGEVWSGVAVATGTAGWFRFFANTVVEGASTSGVRFDGNIATSGADMNMANTSITSGGTTTIDSASITVPAS